MPVGTFAGHLVVDGTFYPVEEVEVKHYTFEVDVYLKDGNYNMLGVPTCIKCSTLVPNPTDL